MNKSKFSLVTLALFALAFVGGLFYTKPLWDEVGSLQKGRDDKVVQRRELNDQLVELQKVQQELNLSSEVSKETTLAAIPEKLDQDEIIRELAAISAQNDVILNGVNFAVPQAPVEGQITSSTVNGNFTGNESQLVSFLKDIEGGSRKMVVKSIAVQFGTTDLGIPRVNFNLTMETYFQGLL
ncbi:MAG TPA: hypothetical protein VI588_04015 [Candidatus Gracilibacteria bacterium]|nr:hypothetical protein [Candidatus Gracilibacteria bacterium]